MRSGSSLHADCALGDGFVALLLPIYLVDLGLSSLAVGTIVASTLILR
jgi:hypothetical protein